MGVNLRVYNQICNSKFSKKVFLFSHFLAWRSQISFLNILNERSFVLFAADEESQALHGVVSQLDEDLM